MPAAASPFARLVASRPRRVAVLWLAAVAASLLWVKATKIGPVVLVVDEARGWGVHTGDAWAMLAVAAAATATPRAWRTPS